MSIDQTTITEAEFVNNKDVRKIISEEMSKGHSAKAIAKEVQAECLQQGMISITDKNGKYWQFDTYAEMWTRYVMATIGREKVFNMAREYGFDLVRVTDHGTDCELCKPYEGEILSLSGKTDGYPLLKDAIDAGLFHVECKHGYAVIPTPK